MTKEEWMQEWADVHYLQGALTTKLEQVRDELEQTVSELDSVEDQIVVLRSLAPIFEMRHDII